MREVKLSDAKLTVHLDDTEPEDIHAAIAERLALGVRYIDDYTIDETYTVERY